MSNEQVKQANNQFSTQLQVSDQLEMSEGMLELTPEEISMISGGGGKGADSLTGDRDFMNSKLKSDQSSTLRFL